MRTVTITAESQKDMEKYLIELLCAWGYTVAKYKWMLLKDIGKAFGLEKETAQARVKAYLARHPEEAQVILERGKIRTRVREVLITPGLKTALERDLSAQSKYRGKSRPRLSRPSVKRAG